MSEWIVRCKERIRVGVIKQKYNIREKYSKSYRKIPFNSSTYLFPGVIALDRPLVGVAPLDVGV